MNFSTYVINLLERTDRHYYIVDHLKEIGIDEYKFLPGFPNSNIGLINPEQTWMKPGQIGFNIAYYNALSFIALNHAPDEFVLLLEDDAVLVDYFFFNLPTNYDVVYLFHKECAGDGAVIKEINGHNIIHLNYPVCTTAIFYKVSAIKEILKWLAPMNTVYDNQIGLRINELKVMGFSPCIAVPSNSPSSINI